MKKKDQSRADDEKAVGLTISKPEDQIFQKLHLCEYLGELFEAMEDANDHRTEKKKDFSRYPHKEPG
jgi:hypothetical protein